MLAVKVKLYATLRQIAGQKTIDVDLAAGATVADLLDAVLARHPEMKTDLLDENGDLFPHVHLFVNGQDAPLLEQALETPIASDDEIDLFPATGGG